MTNFISKFCIDNYFLCTDPYVEKISLLTLRVQVNKTVFLVSIRICEVYSFRTSHFTTFLIIFWPTNNSMKVLKYVLLKCDIRGDLKLK